MASVADILELPRNKYPRGAGSKPSYDPYRDKRQADRKRDNERVIDLDDEELFDKLATWFEDARDMSQDWRDHYKEADEFASGWQWDEADMAILRQESRPVVTFDRTGRNIDLITGMEQQDRKVVAFQPREEGDVGTSDVLSGAAEYVIDQTDSTDEVSDAFRDMVIGGLGWTQTLMNYIDYDAGMPEQLRINPIEMYFDGYAIRRNLKDTRHRERARTMPMDEAKRLFPKTDPALLHAGWARVDDDATINAGDIKNRYDRGDLTSIQQQSTIEPDRVTIIEIEWYEIEDAVLIEDLFTGERTTILKKRAQALIDDFPGRYRAQPMPRKCYYRAFLGGELLAGPVKLEKTKDFTFKAMTGKRDRKLLWTGMVRMMMDPQRWANKWLAQSMHIMNRGAKTGHFYESGAFDDPVKAEQQISKPGALIQVETGAIQNQKIQQIGVGEFPPELDKLMGFALQSIQDCVGVNNEQLGQTGPNTSDANRAALLEQERRKAGVTLMAHYFKSLRLHAIQQGRLLLRYILAYMNDGRLIKITGEGNSQYARLIIEDPDSVEYDIDVGDAPDSPDQRERNWQMIMPMLPMMETLQPPPEVWIKVLRYSPLPAALVDDIERSLQKAQESQGEEPPDPQLVKAQTEAQMTPAQIEKIMAEVEKLKAQTQEILARIELDALEGVRETVAMNDTRERDKLTMHENA